MKPSAHQLYTRDGIILPWAYCFCSPTIPLIWIVSTIIFSIAFQLAGNAATTVTAEFILAVNLFNFAEFRWNTWSKGHEWLSTWLSSKLIGAQDGPNLKLFFNTRVTIWPWSIISQEAIDRTSLPVTFSGLLLGAKPVTKVVKIVLIYSNLSLSGLGSRITGFWAAGPLSPWVVITETGLALVNQTTQQDKIQDRVSVHHAWRVSRSFKENFWYPVCGIQGTNLQMAQKMKCRGTCWAGSDLMILPPGQGQWARKRAWINWISCFKFGDWDSETLVRCNRKLT